MTGSDTMIFSAANEDDTRRLAIALAAAVGPGDVIALEGDLGTGKTTLTRHLARALGVGPDVPVTSPTFTLANHYVADGLEIIHADLYRLGDAAEAAGIGMEEWLGGDRLVLVEWADRIPDVLGDDLLRIRIDHLPEDGRRFTLEATGPASDELLDLAGEALSSGAGSSPSDPSKT